MIRTLALTALAMLAFAANSLLCRAALGEDAVDAASFTALRVVAGALTLSLIVLPRWLRGGPGRGDWRMAAMLLLYMVAFSFAYRSLTAGTGALLLFGAVQLTMFSVALHAGERFTLLAWCGLALAVGGLVYLLLPGVQAPDPVDAGLMVAAGVGWGIYSLLGRGAADPLQATAWNFILCVPAVLMVVAVAPGPAHITPRGAALAIASGALASGLGYVTWYAALRGLAAARAATVQLSVPVIASLGGVMLLGEPLGFRLLIASAATLGGIALVLVCRGRS